MINIKNLSKVLKKCNLVMWHKGDIFNYIVTDYFIIKTTEEIKGTAFTELVKKLGGVPQVGQALRVKCEVQQQATESEMKLLNMLDDVPKDTVEYTKFTYDSDYKFYSVFKIKDQYTYVDKNFFDLVNVNDALIYGSNRVSPLYFVNKENINEIAMFLTVRVSIDSIYLSR